jgi:hypothetical protein
VSEPRAVATGSAANGSCDHKPVLRYTIKAERALTLNWRDDPIATAPGSDTKVKLEWLIPSLPLRSSDTKVKRVADPIATAPSFDTKVKRVADPIATAPGSDTISFLLVPQIDARFHSQFETKS